MIDCRVIYYCACEFVVDPDDPEDNWHFERTCPFCATTWLGLHCPHDRIQNPCPGCGRVPPVEDAA